MNRKKVKQFKEHIFLSQTIVPNRSATASHPDSKRHRTNPNVVQITYLCVCSILLETSVTSDTYVSE